MGVTDLWGKWARFCRRGMVFVVGLYSALTGFLQPLYLKYMDKEIKKEFEGLAGMVKRGFDEVDKRFEQVDRRFEQVDKRFDHLEGRMDHTDARMGRMEADLSEIRGNIVYRHEFEDLLARVKYVETKLGIESGK